MSKTDKEITSEIVCEFIRAYGIQNNCTPVKQIELPNLIQKVYDTVHSLDESRSYK